MKITKKYLLESDAIAGLLSFLFLSLLFKLDIINFQNINSDIFLYSFLALFGITLTILTALPILDPRTFRIIKNQGRKNLLDRTFKTPIIVSILGIFISIGFIFFQNKYLSAFIIGLLVYVILSSYELFRFVYYIKSESNKK